MSGNKGANKLARVLQERIIKLSRQPETLELGTIQNDYSLLTDHFPVPIPKGEYLICRSLSHDPNQPLTTTKEGQGNHPHGPSGEHSQYSGSGQHSHPDTEGTHVHDIVLPESMHPLKPGDRVLVAWIGAEPVIIDIVLSS